MKRLLTFIIIGFTNLLTVHSQDTYKAESFKAALLQTKTGAMVVYNGEKHSFTVDIIGDTIKPTEHPNFVIVDNRILQSSILPFETKLDFENMDIDSQKKNLLGYMKYELDYDKEQLKSKNLNEKYEFVSLNNKIFLFWTFDMPKSNETVAQQCALVTICFDQILVLNMPVTKGKQIRKLETYDKIKEYLLSTGKTLKLNNHTLDLNKLYYELKK